MEWETFIQDAGGKLLDSSIRQSDAKATQVGTTGSKYREGQPATAGALGLSRGTLLIVGAVVVLSAFMLMASRKG